MDSVERCPIHPICNGSSKGLTVRHGSFNPSTQHDDPSTGIHFARDLEKIHYIVMREGRNVVGPTGSSQSVSDGDGRLSSLDKFTSGDTTHFRLTVSRNDFLLTGRLF